MIEQTAQLQIDDAHYRNFYRELCRTQEDKGKRREEKPFPRMADLFVWACVRGLLNESRRAIQLRYPSPPFRWQVIDQDQRQQLLCMILGAQGSLELLEDPAGLKLALEEYATGGVDLIAADMAHDPFAYRTVSYLIDEALERWDGDRNAAGG